METAGKSLLETAELFKRVGSLEITTTAEDAKRKRKQQKDPNAPKRPPGSFFLFANDRRAKLRADHPDKDTKEIAKLLGEEWATLNEKSKKVSERVCERKCASERARLTEIRDNAKHTDLIYLVCVGLDSQGRCREGAL